MLTHEDFTKKIGERICQLRIQQNMTQKQLAEKMNMEGTSIGRIENGARGLRGYTIYRFCLAFNISLKEFMDGIV